MSVELTKPAASYHAKIWAVLRTKKVVTAMELRKIRRDRRYLQLLERHGFIEAISKGTYQLINDVGIDAPRFRGNGNLIAQTAVENMWRTMRILKTFTLAELIAHSESSAVQVAMSTAKNYTWNLKRAGYIEYVGLDTSVMRPGKKPYIMKLIKNTGPKPPQVLKIKEVYDPNIDEIVSREVPDYE